MQLDFCSLFSGSTGNCSYLAFEDTAFLLDAGRTAKAIELSLQSQGLSPARLDAVLLTHEHIDHIRGVGVLARRYGLPVYASPGTWEAIADKLGEIPASQRREFVVGQDFYIGKVNVLPFAIPHDAAEPVGYCLSCQEKKVSFATDLGHTTREIINRVADSDVLLLEANHDVQMLKNGAYPAALKRRILGQRGHLSNEACADTLEELLPLRVRRVFLGHLSQENNVPELAFSTAVGRMDQCGAVVGQDIDIQLTYPNQAAKRVVLR